MRILNLLITLILSLAVLLVLTWAVALPAAAASGTHYVAPEGSATAQHPVTLRSRRP